MIAVHPPSPRAGARRLTPWVPLAVGGVVAGAAFASLASKVPPFLLNASPSEPPGLYVRSTSRPHSGVIIAFKTPAAAFPYANLHLGYLRSRPLLKMIAAGPGDTVCTHDGTLRVNGSALAPIACIDREGRPLPRWRGCRALEPGELFVFSPRVSNSFDSRYYGPIRTSAVLGVYTLVAPLAGERP